jgi:hypothetical protein
VRPLLLSLAILLAGCSGGPPPPAWQASAKYSLDAFQQAYLRGDSRVADLEFARARAELASTGNMALVARAELIRCAARAASLEFDDCPGFEKLRTEASADEMAFAAGRRRCIFEIAFLRHQAKRQQDHAAGNRFRDRYLVCAGLAQAAAGVAGRG